MGQEDELGENALAELQRAQEAFDREMEVSGRVVATELEEVNIDAHYRSRKTFPLRRKQI